MSKLPQVSGRECAKALEKAGFYFKRQEGSHMILRRNEPFAQVVVPDHKELDMRNLTGNYPASWFKCRGIREIIITPPLRPTAG